MNEETMIPGTTGMIVNNGMKSDLLCAAKWTKFLCIIGCIGVAFLVVAGIAFFAVGSNFGLTDSPFGAGMGILYLIMAALYVYPLIKGFQFANATKAACLTDNEAELARGFSGLRACLQFFGILTIIILIIYVLGIIASAFLITAAH